MFWLNAEKAYLSKFDKVIGHSSFSLTSIDNDLRTKCRQILRYYDICLSLSRRTLRSIHYIRMKR